MKHLIYIATLISCLKGQAQNSKDSVDRVFSLHLCDCIGKTKTMTDDKFSICFQEVLEADTNLTRQILVMTNGDTTKDAGHKIGQEIMERISVNLVYTCDAYYHLLDTLRYSAFSQFDIHSEMNKIDSINKVDKHNLTAESYRQRATSYFRTKQFQSALADYNRVLKLDSTDLQSTYFKAWCLETSGDFEGASRLYTKVAEQTGRFEILIFAAIAKRKKNGL